MEKQIKKIKLIYSIELLVFAVVFLVLGFLELFAVIKLSERAQLIFKIVTLVGASYIVIDFIWLMFSEKRKKKNSLMDKIMLLPIAAYLFVYDILGFVLNPGYGYYQIGVPIIFLYLACVYIFQGIYHYYHPVPMVNEMIEEVKNPKVEEPIEQIDSQEENNSQEAKEENKEG